jgi:restriction system protein
MAIWHYEALSRVPSTAAFFSTHCIFCGCELTAYSNESGAIQELPSQPPEWRSGSPRALGTTTYTICHLCGWWTLLNTEEMHSRRGLMAVFRGAVGALRDIDKIDVALPLGEVQQYLLANRKATASLDWRLMEETVGDVFRSLGFQSRLTSRSGDGGIDVFLSDDDGQLVGVQVKRYRNKITAEQIRSFLGALVNRGVTEGIYVTTSDFQRGAKNEATVAAARGYRIELVDGETFLQTIGIARLEDPSPLLESIPDVYETRRLWRSPIP